MHLQLFIVIDEDEESKSDQAAGRLEYKEPNISVKCHCKLGPRALSFDFGAKYIELHITATPAAILCLIPIENLQMRLHQFF
jgi:hypothetical protein